MLTLLGGKQTYSDGAVFGPEDSLGSALPSLGLGVGVSMVGPFWCSVLLAQVVALWGAWGTLRY